MKNKHLIAVAIVCIMVGTIGIGSAHQTWLDIDNICVDLNDSVDVRITEGHNFIGEGVPPNNVSAELVVPDGSTISLNKTNETGLCWCSSFKADQLGLYTILGLHVENNFYKIYTGPGSRDDYPDYPYTWIESEVNWSEINKSKWADDWHVVRNSIPHKYSKAFVSTNCSFYEVNSTNEQPLEIFPVDDISTIGTGDFRFKVLWEGSSLPNGTIKITGTKDEDTKVSALCDENGIAALPLNVTGDWLISADAVDDSVHWDGAFDGDFPHGDNYTDDKKAFVGNTHSAALTLLEFPHNIIVNAPDVISGPFDVTIDIENISNMNGGQFDLSFDPGVVNVTNVTDGSINDTAVPVVDWRLIDTDTIRVLFRLSGVEGVSGSGYAAKINFEITGSQNDTSILDISDVILSDTSANNIPAIGVDDEVTV